MKSLLGKILRDVVLDDVVVIHAAVDVAHKMVAKDNFTPFIMDILLEIFNVESSIPPIRTISFDEFIPQPQDNISRIFQVNEYCGTPRVASADMESNDKVTSDSGNDPMASSSEQAVAQEENTAIAMNEMETSIKDNEIHDEKETSIKDNEIHDDDNEPEIQSQPDPVPTKEKDIMKLKTEVQYSVKMNTQASLISNVLNVMIFEARECSITTSSPHWPKGFSCERQQFRGSTANFKSDRFPSRQGKGTTALLGVIRTK